MPDENHLGDSRISPDDRKAETQGGVTDPPASPDRLRAMLDAIPQMVWSTLPDGYHDFYNARWYEFTGMPKGSTDGAGWNDMFHPDDQERAWARWRHSLATGEPYEIDYRLRHHSGRYRWTLGRALPLRDDRGNIIRWFGTCTDIDEFKRAEQNRELIAAELSHRMKNIFAVVSSLIALSARDHPEAQDFAATIQSRIAALARANDYVRPHVGHHQFKPAGHLKGLIAALIEPYQTENDRRIHVHGGDLAIGIRTATALALVLHELATNAVKYGALSVADGRVDIDAAVDAGILTLTWQETGGPEIDATPARRGFGTEMAQRAASAQLRGTINNDWRSKGLVMTLRVPISGLER